jgi:hypothetical protein
VDNFPNRLTRRSLLRTGAAASAGLMIGFRPWATAPAAASGGHLVRATYASLVGQGFAAGPATLRLESVSDVAGAVLDTSLAGREDAFVLTFSAPLEEALESGTHTLRHPDIGTFELFVSPVSTEQRYEAVIDRSVGVRKARRAAAT